MPMCQFCVVANLLCVVSISTDYFDAEETCIYPDPHTASFGDPRKRVWEEEYRLRRREGGTLRRDSRAFFVYRGSVFSLGLPFT